MKIKDLYPMLENLYELRGVHVIDGDDYIMYAREAVSYCYLEYSNVDIVSFEYKNKYMNIYI